MEKKFLKLILRIRRSYPDELLDYFLPPTLFERMAKCHKSIAEIK